MRSHRVAGKRSPPERRAEAGGSRCKGACRCRRASTGPGRFTAGDLLRHIAGTERWMWAENACLRPSRYPGHGIELAEGRAAVLDYMDRLHAETLEILGGLSPDDLEKRCTTVGGADMRVWKWLRLMVEHEIHHRGQLYEVLAQAGVETPSLYGLTEAQVRERSI